VPVISGAWLLERLAAAGTAGPARLDATHPLLAGRTGRGVSVAVIDSGVNPAHPHIRLERLGRLFGIEPDGAETGDAVDRLGHGTAVAAAIQEKAPDATLHIIRVFTDRLSTTSAVLVRAIGLAADSGAQLINLSLGTPRAEHVPALVGAVERAAAMGALIIAADRAAGAPCYPGALEGVLGVALDAGCARHAMRLEAGILHASGFARPVPGVPPDRNLNGISFAVANATGLLACILEWEAGEA
jgi:subtilisin family serine protease